MKEKLFWFVMIILLFGGVTLYSALSSTTEKQERPYTAGCP